ncbi:MAG: biopolymer transporter ExbD [Bacteriovoracaceae bacterium]|nr:biopolymer transporter ExbD [Bacteriovoracaceae bacterium]
MALKKKKSKKMTSTGTDVNITSLMDVLTVLLFFLIKSATVSSLELTPPKGMKLPTAEMKEEPKEAIKIALSKDMLVVDEKTMVKLDAGRFPASYLMEDGRTIKPLKEFLVQEYQKKKDFYKDVADENVDLLPPPTLLIQADHKLPFGTLKHLLHTAAISGFADYQFVVETPGE